MNKYNKEQCIYGKYSTMHCELCSAMCKERYEDFKNKGVSGSAQLALTIEKLEKMPIVNPDLTLQNQFAAFVEQTDKSKSAVKQVLEKAETLKKALMQEYFG